MKARTLRGVLLDVDGTLVDSNDAHARSWVESLREHGIEVALAEVQKRIGKGGDKLLPEVSGIADDSPRGKAIGARRAEIFRVRYLPALAATRGARSLVEMIRARGLLPVVVSSAKLDELAPLLEVAGCERLISARTSADDAASSKPDPDIVHAALRSTGLTAATVVMVGDTPYDIESAKRAGIATVALRTGGWSDHDLRNAAAIYDDPADLVEHFDDSPLAV